MSGRSKILTWGLPAIGAITLIGGAGLVIENRPVRPEEEPPRPPTTAPSLEGSQDPASDASRFIGAIGISEPPGEPIGIASHRAGVVTSVEVSVGNVVDTETPLFSLDARAGEALVELRKADVRVAEAQAESLRSEIPTRRATLEAAEAALASARAGVEAAEADEADRANQLRIAESVNDPRAIAQEEVDRRRFAHKQAQARTLTARAAVTESEASIEEAHARLARLESPEAGGAGPELRAAIAQVEEARQNLASARTELALLTVNSPVAGTVLQVNIRPGEFAPASVPSEGLIVLGRSGPTHLRVEVDEVDIPRFRKRAKAWASPRGDATLRVPLELAYVEPLVVPKTNLSGRTSELVDTRVLQVVYEMGDGYDSVGVGQQFDVYIEAMEVGK